MYYLYDRTLCNIDVLCSVFFFYNFKVEQNCAVSGGAKYFGPHVFYVCEMRGLSV